MFFRGLIFVALLAIFSACELGPMNYHHNIATSGKGEWNIDELRVTAIDYYTSVVVYDTVFYNHGIITYSGDRDAAQWEMEKAVPLANYDAGPYSGKAEFLTSDILMHIGAGTGISWNFIDAQIIKIKKKEMILFAPWTLNTLSDANLVFDLYFKLAKK